MIQFQCDLINQRSRLCMRADKRTLFQFTIPESSQSSASSQPLRPTPFPPDANLVRDHLLSKSQTLRGLSSHSIVNVREGQLVLHSLKRCLTFTQSQQLASLAKLTHEKHFDLHTQVLCDVGSAHRTGYRYRCSSR